jgi:hypothetical protein
MTETGMPDTNACPLSGTFLPSSGMKYPSSRRVFTGIFAMSAISPCTLRRVRSN